MNDLIRYDLVLKGGRVVDPAQGLDKVTDIAFSGGKVAAIGDNLQGKDIRPVAGKIVVPGLIDLHTHVYWGGTSLGVEAELLARTGGVTTSIDAGSAGPGNFHGFRRHVIETSPVRILPFLNVAFPGIFAFSKTVMVGECQDMRLIDPREAVRVGLEHKDLILGIKVRVGKSASGDSGDMPLHIALDVAEELGLPLMAHLDAPPPARHEVVPFLRKGDILTHCFRPFPNAPPSRRRRPFSLNQRLAGDPGRSPRDHCSQARFDGRTGRAHRGSHPPARLEDRRQPGNQTDDHRRDRRRTG